MWFIDSDNVIRINGLRNAETLEYIVNAEEITGILYELPAIHPDKDGEAQNKDPKVWIPCKEHELKDDDNIRVERSWNYNKEYVLQTGTTDTDVLVITASYAEEKFTGEEFIYKAAVDTDGDVISIGFGFVPDSNGDYVGKISYKAQFLQGESYVLCIKEKSGGEQVLVKVIHVAGFQGL